MDTITKIFDFLSKFSREAFLFFYKVDNNTPLRALSPTLFYFLKVVSREFACFRGGSNFWGAQSGGSGVKH